MAGLADIGPTPARMTYLLREGPCVCDPAGVRVVDGLFSQDEQPRSRWRGCIREKAGMPTGLRRDLGCPGAASCDRAQARACCSAAPEASARCWPPAALARRAVWRP